MWFDEILYSFGNLNFALSLIPGITLWIFTIVVLRRKVNDKKEFGYFIKGGLLCIFLSSSTILPLSIFLSFLIFDESENATIIISVLANMIINILMFRDSLFEGNIYKLERNGLTYYENRKLEKLIKKEEKRIGKKLDFETELELKHRIENERKETDIYIYSNGDEAVKICGFYQRKKKIYINDIN